MPYDTIYRLILDPQGLASDEACDRAELALHAALRALPDGGLAACAAISICASALGDDLVHVYVDHTEIRVPTAEECAAYRDWCACEQAADAAAFAGWARRPQSGGITYSAEAR